jgi:hypothetical protein
MIERIGQWALHRWRAAVALLLLTIAALRARQMDEVEPASVDDLQPLIDLAVEQGLREAGAKPRRERIRRARRPDAEMLRLKRNILDQLDDNTKIFGRMKVTFPMEYGLYSQVGAVIIERTFHDQTFENTVFQDLDDDLQELRVSPWFNQTRPGFGALVTGNPHDRGYDLKKPLHPRLTHFLKVKEPKERLRRMFGRGRAHDIVQPIRPGSDLYFFTLYFDEQDWARLFPVKTRDDRERCRFYRKAFAIELPLELSEDGVLRPLKVMWDQALQIGPKSRSRQPMGYSDVRRSVRGWDYPWPKGSTRHFKTKITPEQLILFEAASTLRVYEEGSSSMIQVRAAKNDICTLINVDIEETPDFFLDREDVVIDGIKKRIFHIVRPHERILGFNRSTNVHMHFRGLRQFVWNGYEIEISVPGRDHFPTDDFNCATTDIGEAPNSFSMPEIGAWLVANQKARWRAMVGNAGALIPMDKFRSPPPPASPG